MRVGSESVVHLHKNKWTLCNTLRFHNHFQVQLRSIKGADKSAKIMSFFHFVVSGLNRVDTIFGIMPIKQVAAAMSIKEDKLISLLINKFMWSLDG